LPCRFSVSHVRDNNPNIPIDEKVEDMLNQMTLGEKAGQMCQYYAGSKDADQHARDDLPVPSSRKCGWILSRTSLTLEEKQSVDSLLRRDGYSPADFIPTGQTAR
jgi:hypothetical protein